MNKTFTLLLLFLSSQLTFAQANIDGIVINETLLDQNDGSSFFDTDMDGSN